MTQALHSKINLTLSSLDEKISALQKDFKDKRQRAFHALHTLHGGDADNEKAEPQPTIQQPAAPENAPEARYPVLRQCSSIETCVCMELFLCSMNLPVVSA